jgi:hypothetical protein
MRLLLQATASLQWHLITTITDRRSEVSKESQGSRPSFNARTYKLQCADTARVCVLWQDVPLTERLDQLQEREHNVSS